MDTLKYIKDLFVVEDDFLSSINESLKDIDMPAISINPIGAKILYMLVKISNSNHILEIGTLGGYSSIWLAKALEDKKGMITTIEIEEKHAKVARENFKKANVENKVNLINEDAFVTIDRFIQERNFFDLIFVDSEKKYYPEYLEKIMQISKSGTLLIFDNLLLGGRVLDKDDLNRSPTAVRKLNETIANHANLDSILLPVGDGIGVCRVK